MSRLTHDRRRRDGEGAKEPTRLFYDTFSSADEDPLTSPRTSNIGRLIAVQNDGKFAISSGAILTTAQLTVAAGDLQLCAKPAGAGDNWARTAGRAMAIKVNRTSGTHAFYPAFGWFNQESAAAEVNDVIGFYPTGVQLRQMYSTLQIAPASVFSSSADYTLVLVQRAVGAFYIVKSVALGEFTLLTATNFINTTPLYAVAPSYDCVETLDNLQIMDLGAPFNTEFGLATAVNETPGAGATLVGSADGTVEFTWTPQAGQTLNLMVRRTDDDNCWIVRCVQAASRIYLYEKQGGVETERGAAGGVAATWTVGTAYTIRVNLRSQQIVVFIGAGSAKITYATAAFNAAATGIKTDLAGADLVSWPYTLSGAALSELNRFFSLTTPAGTYVLYEGDSLTEGLAVQPLDYPHQCDALLSPAGSANSGTGGQHLSLFDGGDSYLDNITYAKTINVVWGGTNDIEGGDSLATVQATMATYIANRKLRGWEKVIALTIAPRADAPWLPAMETIRQDFNTWLLANYAGLGFDAVVDVASDPDLSDPNDATYYADKLHMTAAGYAVVAGLVAAAVAAL